MDKEKISKLNSTLKSIIEHLNTKNTKIDIEFMKEIFPVLNWEYLTEGKELKIGVAILKKLSSNEMFYEISKIMMGR